MPIPFLVAGAIAASALTGVGSGINAAMNNQEAKDVNNQAKKMISESEKALNKERKLTNATIEMLGEEKISILASSIKEFVHSFQSLKHVQFDDATIGIEELKNIGVSKDLLTDLETESFKAAKIASGGLTSLGTGVAAAYGAYAGTMALGTASTGAAISGLSGVAATNATLAWLGGGALSAGGYGIAGGTMVLGGVVAGPALAVGGLFMSAQSKKKLNAAHENLSEAKTVKEQMTTATKVLTSIKKRSKQLHQLLTKANIEFKNGIETMEAIITNKGTNWNDLPNDDKKSIHRTFLLAQLIKGIIDTPLLDEDGEMTKQSAQTLQAGSKALNELTAEKMAS